MRWVAICCWTFLFEKSCFGWFDHGINAEDLANLEQLLGSIILSESHHHFWCPTSFLFVASGANFIRGQASFSMEGGYDHPQPGAALMQWLGFTTVFPMISSEFAIGPCWTQVHVSRYARWQYATQHLVQWFLRPGRVGHYWCGNLGIPMMLAVWSRYWSCLSMNLVVQVMIINLSI